MKCHLVPEASAEMEEAARYYEASQSGLGHRFLNAIETSLQDIAQSPDRWPILEPPIRRRLVPVFPYAILYTCDPESVLVLAVMHCHRQPGYWKKRTKPSS